ncbi:MAG TPA: serine hydrolase [Candidatus Scybalocola faecipullorum]|nr:serine hydrolase [Candidatus Scybalocola faecipullorum]
MEISEKIFSKIAAEAMTEYHIPGLAFAVTDQNKTLFEYTDGVCDLVSRKPITRHTHFAMASCTKSVTAALIGMLVDEGVLDYDVPVKYYLNDFQMYDPFAAESLTLRDILCHRSGIGGHEGMWPSEMSHKEFLEKLRYLEPNVPFRYCSQYSSVMYTAAGYIAELAAGKPWEALVREKLIKPLGMTESGFSAEEMVRTGDYASGHYLYENRLEKMPVWEMRGAEPAASLYSNLEDMEKWVRFQLAEGLFEQRRLISKKNMQQMHQSQMARSFKPWVFDECPDVGGFGMGWMIRVYRGLKMIFHHGEIEGYCSLQVLVPQLNRAFVMMANRHSSCHGFFYTLLFTALDMILGIEIPDWGRRLSEKAGTASDAELVISADAVLGFEPCGDQRLSGSLCSGVYYHPAYGTVVVHEDGDNMIMEFRQQRLPLHHLEGNIYQVMRLKEDTLFMTLPVQFRTTGSKVNALAVPLEPSVAAIVFKKQTERGGQ